MDNMHTELWEESTEHLHLQGHTPCSTCSIPGGSLGLKPEGLHIRGYPHPQAHSQRGDTIPVRNNETLADIFSLIMNSSDRLTNATNFPLLSFAIWPFIHCSMCKCLSPYIMCDNCELFTVCKRISLKMLTLMYPQSWSSHLGRWRICLVLYKPDSRFKAKSLSLTTSSCFYWKERR